MTDLPWYHDGLNSPARSAAIAAPVRRATCGSTTRRSPPWPQLQGLPVDEFEEQFVRRVGARKSLKEFPNGDCVFFDGQTRKCTVYAARPRQCRTWPFWDSNLKTPADWKHTCSVCPGSGQGQLHSLEQIEAQRKVVKV